MAQLAAHPRAAGDDVNRMNRFDSIQIHSIDSSIPSIFFDSIFSIYLCDLHVPGMIESMHITRSSFCCCSGRVSELVAVAEYCSQLQQVAGCSVAGEQLRAGVLSTPGTQESKYSSSHMMMTMTSYK